MENQMSRADDDELCGKNEGEGKAVKKGRKKGKPKKKGKVRK